MSSTYDFYETLGASHDLEREYGGQGGGSLYLSIKTFAMAYSLAQTAGLSVEKVPSQYDIPNIVLDEWPAYLQPAAGAIADDVQFVHNLIENVADDEAEAERLKAALKDAINEDLKATIADARDLICEAGRKTS